MMLSLYQIAQALGGEVSGGQVLAPGPGHSAADRSLSIRINDAGDDFVVHCFADGDDPIQAKDYVRAKLGLPAWQPRMKRNNGNAGTPTITGLAPKNTRVAPAPSAAARTLLCNYDYTDLDGNLVYQVQRWRPKAFSQRRPNGRGAWTYTDVFEGIGRVPYRWPELAAEMAAYPDAVIFICEGEKDTDNVRKLGLFATCVAGGVWTQEIAAALKDHDIIYLEDNDKAGREKSAKAGQALNGIAKSIRIARFTDLREKSDVSDWIALDPEKHNADALIDRCRNAPLWEPQEENATEQTGEADEPLGEWDAGLDDAPISPRGWLLGSTFCRSYVSSVIAEGGVGKSALRQAQLLSLAVGRPLTGEHVFMRCRVLLVSLEDDRDEVRRRLRAACLHHGIERKELEGWLFLAAPGAAGGKLMLVDAHGQPVKGKLAAKLARVIEEHRIDIVSVDPFVKCHNVPENDNGAIDQVVQVLVDLAAQYNVAVDVPHHAAKGPADPGNANRGRGAWAMKDAGRLVYTLMPMSPDEAKVFGLDELERRRLVRLDSAKVNITPPWSEAKWFRLVGVNIGNPTDLYPSGDQVQTVERWTPPNVFTDLSTLTINQILTQIDVGLPDGNRYTDAPNAVERAAWRVIAKYCEGKSEPMCRRIIKLWLDSGLLIRRTYDNKDTRKAVIGLWVDNAKRPT